MNSLRWTLIFLALAGATIALIALYYHFDDSGESFCNINDRFNCETVYSSPYSYILGVPVPLLGVLGYGAFATLILLERKLSRALDFTRKDYWLYLAIFASIMLSFQIVMTLIEIFLIQAYCVLCIASQIIILLVALLAWRGWASEQSI